MLGALKKRSITADFVQIGNEINPGMLWALGQTWDVDTSDGVPWAQWENLGSFLTAGAQAAKQISPRTRVLLHLTNINNGIDSLTWWLDNAVAQSVPFDMVGLSYYGYWHGSLRDLQTAISTLATRYDKDVLVLETAYPWTLADNPNTPFPNVIDTASKMMPGYPATPAGQAANLRAVQDTVASVPGGRGVGTVYWEPAWTAVPGSGWDPTDPVAGNAWGTRPSSTGTAGRYPPCRVRAGSLNGDPVTGAMDDDERRIGVGQVGVRSPGRSVQDRAGEH